MTLEVTITGTTVAHTLITNGALTTLGPNHWSVAFPTTPPRCRRCSRSALRRRVPLADNDHRSTDGGSDNHRGGVDDDEQRIDLAAELADLSAWLVEDDSQIGAYLHGDRFVTFLLQGGME